MPNPASTPPVCPSLGPQIPQSGNVLSRGLGRLVLRLLGWRVEGQFPDVPKMVLIGAPHTSNYDAVVAFAALLGMGLRASTMVKDSAFKGPVGGLLRALGAVPINRSSPKNVVQQTVEAFQTRERFVLLLAPEGTRTAAPSWKRGFYHVAQEAGVPIVPAAIDYQRKRIWLGPALLPSGQYERDLQTILDYFGSQSAARHPQRLSRPMAEAQGRSWQATKRARP